MQKTAPTFGRLLTMVLFALSCFGLLLFLWISFGGNVPLQPKGYRIKAAFPEATQLGLEADVRMAGVSIGKVRKKDIDRAHPNLTVATIEVDPKYAPLPSDVRAILRLKTLLGETYVELTGGSRTAPKIKDNGWLAEGQVKQTVQLDEIFQALDPKTRQSFRTWQQNLAGAASGRGQDLNDAIGNLPSLATDGDALLTVLDAQSGAVRRLVRNTGVVFGALTQNEAQLHNLIVNAGDTFDATSSQQNKLAETFHVFPTFLDESKVTLARLQTFAKQTDPLIQDLRPATRDLGPTLADVRRLSPDLVALYQRLGPLIDASKTGLPALRDLLRGAKPVLGSAQPFLEQLNPILQWLEYHQSTVADFIANGGAALSDTVPTRTTDERGHYLRQFGPVGPSTVSIASDRRATPGQVERGNAYLLPDALSGPERAKKMIFPNFDCYATGEPGNGEYMTKLPDTNDKPSCFLAKPPPVPAGNTRLFPHIEAADYSKSARRR
jgi:phospholipid/cholesterol/gamma-HCH transport system substrate-binding protein